MRPRDSVRRVSTTRVAPLPGAESIDGDTSEAGNGSDAVILAAILLLARENPLRQIPKMRVASPYSSQVAA